MKSNIYKKIGVWEIIKLKIFILITYVLLIIISAASLIFINKVKNKNAVALKSIKSDLEILQTQELKNKKISDIMYQADDCISDIPTEKLIISNFEVKDADKIIDLLEEKLGKIKVFRKYTLDQCKNYFDFIDSKNANCYKLVISLQKAEEMEFKIDKYLHNNLPGYLFNKELIVQRSKADQSASSQYFKYDIALEYYWIFFTKN